MVARSTWWSGQHGNQVNLVVRSKACANVSREGRA